MATYVNNLRLTELATGEGSGTWGTTTNTSLELIGEALGFNTQNCFSSDADATTTVADGATDPARAFYFKVTSSATLTATRTLTIAPNTVSRVMFIENATTGSQSINISQGSGANVTIATGKTAVVYLDGAGSGAAVVDAMAGVDPGVTDTLAEVLAAGNTTGGTNIVFGDSSGASDDRLVFGAGSDLQLYHDGSHSYIEDAAGTGNLKLRTNTLRIENAAGTELSATFVQDGAVTLYNDNSIKLATTSTGIDVTGTAVTDGLTVESTGATFFNATVDAGTGLTTLKSTNNSTGGSLKIQTGGNDRFQISAGGDISFFEDTGTTAKLFFDASAESLGIGTTSPNFLLDVEGSGSLFRINATSGDATAQFSVANTTSLNTINFGDSGSTTSGQILYRHNGDSMAFNVGGAEAIRILDGGNVGIGTSSPSDALHVLDSSGNAYISVARSTQSQGEVGLRLRGGTSGNDWYVYQKTSSNNLNFFNTADRVTIDVSGQVGIGTSSPSSELHVKSTDGEVALNLEATTARLKINGNNFISATSSVTTFGVDGTERMRIDSSGNAVLGATSVSNPNSYGAVFNIEGYAPALVLSEDTGRDYTIGVNGNKLQIFDETTAVMTIDDSGNVGIGTTSPASALELEGVGNATNVTLDNTTSSTGRSYSIRSGNTGNLDFYDNDATTARVTINSSGNVGINQANPTRKLHVTSAGSGVVATFGDSQANNTLEVTRTTSNASYSALLATSAVGGFVAGPTMAFSTSNSGGGSISERARIDSSGNFLVGTTTTSAGNEGMVYFNGSSLRVTRDGDEPLNLDRLTSDGSLVDFKKDGSTVGSIGTNTTANFRITSTQSGHSGIEFGTATILPTIEGTGSNGGVDLGASTQRFKDLHVSNSVKNASGGLAVESGSGNQLLLKASSELIFTANASERARINTSGDVFIGKTGPGFGTVGTEIQGTGRVRMVRDGGTVLELNRETSDGAIAAFYKDASLVGTVGTNGGDLFVGTGDTNILFSDGSDALVPANTGGATRDSAIDLGTSGAQFKDLRLSGAVHCADIIANGSGGLALQTDEGTKRIIIEDDGDVVINETGADSDFRVEGSGNANALFVQGSNGYIGVGNNSPLTPIHSKSTSTGEQLRIESTDSGGAFGPLVGFYRNSSSPANGDGLAQLHFYGESSVGNLRSYATIGAIAANVSNGVETGRLVIATRNAGTDEQSRIDMLTGGTVFNQGGVDLNFTVESDNNANMLFVDAGNDSVVVGSTSTTDSASFSVLSSGTAASFRTTPTTATNLVIFRNGNGLVGSISTSGSATAYNTSSDQRLKDNIVNAPSASDDIDAIQVRSFDWKADGSHQKYGMVAQELQSVAPEAVTGDADSDEMMGVDYSKLVPMMMKEIQSLRARVAQLESN